MLGIVMLESKEDTVIKEKEGVFIFKKGEIYTGRFEFNNIKIYDEKDNAISLNYTPSCFRINEHYSKYFNFIDQIEIENKKHFYKLRKLLRSQ